MKELIKRKKNNMDAMKLIKSVLDGEQSAVVLCDLNHTILYMNKFAINRYHGDLTGKSVLDCHNADSVEKIKKTLEWFKADKSHNQIFETHVEKDNRDIYTIALRDENDELIGYWEKHMYRNPDTGKFYDYY